MLDAKYPYRGAGLIGIGAQSEHRSVPLAEIHDRDIDLYHPAKHGLIGVRNRCAVASVEILGTE